MNILEVARRPRLARLLGFDRLAGMIAALALSVVPAQADGFVTPFLGWNFGGNSVNCDSLGACQEKHTNFGMSIGTAGRVAGMEEDFSFAKNFYDASADNSVLTIMFGTSVGVRGDIRRFNATGLTLLVFSGAKADFWRASVGLTFRY